MKKTYLIFCLFALFFSPIAAQNSPTKLSYAEIDSLRKIAYEKGDYEEVLRFFVMGKEKAKAEFGVQDSIYAEYTYNAGYIYGELEQFEEAETLLLEAKDIYLKNNKKEHPTYATIIYLLGNLYKDTKQLDLAEALLLESKAIRASVIGTMQADYAATLLDLGLLYHLQGKYEKAEPLYLEAKKIDEKVSGANTIDYSFSLGNLAALYEDMGRYDQAEPLYLESKKIRANILGQEHPDYAVAVNNLALLYQTMGRFEESEQLTIEARTIYAKTLGKEHSNYATATNNLALLYRRMDRFKEAEALYLEAKEIYGKTLGKMHPKYALSLNNLSIVYQKLNRFAEAEQMLMEANKIREKVLGKEHHDYVQSLSNLALLYKKNKQFDKAEKLYIEAKDIRLKISAPDHPLLASSLNSLADVYQLTHRKEKAWEYLLKTIQVCSGMELSTNISAAWADSLLSADIRSYQHAEELVGALGSMYELLDGQASAQLIVADAALRIVKKCRNKLYSYDDKLRMLSYANNWVLKYLKVVNKKTAASKALEIAELNKSVLLMEASKNEKAYQMGSIPDSLVSLEKGLLKKQAQLQVKLLEKMEEAGKDKIRSSLNDLNAELQAFKKNIETKFPKYAKIKYSETEFNVADIQKLLSPKTAILEYVVGDSIIYIFYLDKTRLLVFEKFIANSLLKSHVETFHGILSNFENQGSDEAFASFSENAFMFYELLLKDALSAATGITQLMIVPDAELSHLPFEAFLTEKSNSKKNYAALPYLLKKFNISYNYSTALWKENKEASRNKNNGELFALAANYVSKSDSIRSKKRSPTYRNMRDALGSLPAARQEVEQLQKTYAGFFAFDLQASEKVFKQKASAYGIIHLAMHGLLNPKSPILSSLAFTEDADSVENNFLQAYEISKMELNADLVVLSACETGYGKFEKGNGTASLARAFMYAGVPALVVSLWQVNDASTSLVMTFFYKNLAKGMDKAEALQKAKLEYIKLAEANNAMAAHPAFWAAFVLLGDSRPIKISQKSDGMIWWIAGGGLLAAAAGTGIYALRRRKQRMG